MLEERAATVWRSLLGSDTALAWRGWRTPGFPAGWQIRDGVLSKDGLVDDLMTVETFGDFELELDWRIGPGGNSGLFYRATRDYDFMYWSGPEYQLLDDAEAGAGGDPLSATAAVYGLYPAAAKVARPCNEWNITRLWIRGSHVEHWLNGCKVVGYELQSPDWTSRVAASKFSAYPAYGLAKAGVIGLQGDHAGAVAVRQMRIRELL